MLHHLRVKATRCCAEQCAAACRPGGVTRLMCGLCGLWTERVQRVVYRRNTSQCAASRATQRRSRSTMPKCYHVVTPGGSSHQRGRGAGLVLPGGRQLLGALVVACQAVDAALDQDQPELAVLVLAVALKVLAHAHRLLDQVVQVLGDLRRKACGQMDQQTLAQCEKRKRSAVEQR